MYDRRMRALSTWAAVLGLAINGVATLAHADDDRLSRFRELSHLLSDAGDAPVPVDPDAALAEMFALVDDEILENLKTGEPFASPAFIQERLDAFMAAWGGAAFRVHRAGRATDSPSLTVGVFTVPGSAPRGSLRGYGRTATGEWSVLATSTHDGVPELHPWPAGRDGTARIAVSWLGPGSGTGGRPFVLEVWRRTARGTMERAWTTSTPFPDGLWTLDFKVSPGQMTVRYEARYPGWKPGCDGQTEHVDVYRRDSHRDGLGLAARKVLNGWHRELQAAAARLVAALAVDEQGAVAALVPDRGLRARLPRHLVLEPACDQRSAGGLAIVAATEEDGARMVPWSLTWRLTPVGWRLRAATPVLE